MTFAKSPIIIVAAGRSGTKMLRSILASHPDVVCFPREINYIWRHGNIRFPTDEFMPEHARPEVVRYIRKRFKNQGAGKSNARIVEKTCANALRVDFVHTVMPEAYVIHLIRDGRAVTESARRRWLTPNPVSYLLKKAHWVPLSDVPYYAVRYLRYRLGSVRSTDGAYSSWGPRFTGLDKLVAEKTLIEVCGLQWKACVRAADAAMKWLPSEKAITVRYEDLVCDSLATAQTIFDQINLTLTDECRAYIENEVHRDDLNKWQERLSAEDLRLLMPHIKTELHSLGYDL